MLWECISSSRCECGGLDREKAATFRPNAFGGDTRDKAEQWQFVVQQYSGLDLSHASDKLTALAGIAEQFQAELGCKYVAGLWHDHLLSGLPWMLADGHKACRRPPYRSPTWSWASLDNLSSPEDTHHGVRVTYVFTKSMQQDSRLAVVDVSIKSNEKTPFGDVEEGGFIVLEAAFLIPCKAAIETDITMINELESTLILQFQGYEKQVRVDPDIAFTSLPIGICAAPYAAEDLRWLVLGKDKNKHHGLLLVPSAGKKDVYERAGMARIQSPLPELQNKAEVSRFKIV